MNLTQEFLLKSYRRIVRLYTRRKDKIDVLGTDIKDEVEILDGLVSEIDALNSKTKVNTKRITKEKANTKEFLVNCGLQLASALWLYFTRDLKNETLAATVAFTKEHFNTTDEDLPALINAIITASVGHIPALVVATEENPNPTQPANPVGKRGGTPQLVKLTKDTLTLFMTKSPVVRDIQKDVVGYNETIDSKFVLTQASVKNLSLMFTAGFLTTDILLYDEWLRASRPDNAKTMHTRIGGVITDQSNGVGIPHAKVTAVNLETGTTYKNRSFAGGKYSLQLPIGTYTVKFGKGDYEEKTITPVIVEEEGKKKRVDAALVPKQPETPPTV